MAVLEGNEEIVKYMVDHGADVNKTDTYRRTPLILAVLKGNKEIVKSLVDHGADINKKSKDGETPLSIAKRKGFNEIVKILKTAGANHLQKFLIYPKHLLGFVWCGVVGGFISVIYAIVHTF